MSYKKLLVLAFALIVVANIMVLGSVAFKRAEVVSELTFSERELSRSYQSDFDGGVGLQLQWRTPNPRDYWARSLTVNPRVLSDLGFKANCTRYGGRSTERKGYVLMELAGNAWQNAKALDIARLQQDIEKAENTAHKKALQREIDEWDERHTRLYATAVAADADALKTLIKDAKKQFILPAFLTADCTDNEVFIRRLSIERLHLNTEESKDGTLPAKYEVTVAVGVLGDAWITRLAPR